MNSNNELINQVCKKVSNYEIIGLGEATHGNYKNAVLRSNIIKTLIKTHFVREIVLEDDVKLVNTIMVNNGANLKQIMPYMMHPWDNSIMEELLEWIIKWNTKNSSDKVSVYGVDVNNQNIIPFKHKIKPSLSKVYTKYAEQMNNSTLNERQHTALRDKIMYNLFKEQHIPESKCVLIFHNSHLNHSGYQKAMGYYIKEHFGDKYIAVANTFIRGSYSGWFYGEKYKLKSEYQVISVSVKDTIYNANKPTFFSPPPAKHIWLPDSYVDNKDPYKFFYKKNTNGFDAVLLINNEIPLHSYKEQEIY